MRSLPKQQVQRKLLNRLTSPGKSYVKQYAACLPIVSSVSPWHARPKTSLVPMPRAFWQNQSLHWQTGPADGRRAPVTRHLLHRR